MHSDFQEFPPHPALRSVVDRFWARSSESAPGARPTRILPDGCIDLVVNVETATAFAVGAMTRAVLLEPRGRIRIIGVRFRPGCATPFLRVPADELTDRFVGAADAGVHWLDTAQFGDMTDLRAAVRTLERTLLHRLHAVREPQPEIARAVSALFAASPPSVAELARCLGWSRQHLGRALRRTVGVSPRRLARVARLQRALTLLHHDRHLTLAAAGIRAGYFDQAHMTRDFRELAGVTPQTAARAHGSIRPVPSLFDGL